MTAPSLNTLLPILLLVSPACTRPSFRRFLTLFAGWVSTSGVHAVTESLVVAGVSGTLHHAAFHRFFSRARWCLDEVGHLLLLKLVALVPGPLRLVLDDTLCTHKGPKVFGLGVHVDAVRSTRKTRLLTFGHVWVVLAVLVPVPFSGRVWALPILFRLFRTQADCQKRGGQHLKKTQLARQLIEQVKLWLPDKDVELVADTAYSCREVLRHLPHGVVFVGAMRGDSTLHRPRSRKYRSHATGRLLTRDILLPKPAKIAQDEKVPNGELPLHVFFCTDCTRTARQVIESYCCRWAIEVLFRDLKQLLGFSSSRARSRLAVLRTAPWVGVCYTLLVLWYMELGLDTSRLCLPIRPWYRTKRTVAFADILRLAQRTLSSADWVDPFLLLAGLQDSTPPPQPRAA